MVLAQGAAFAQEPDEKARSADQTREPLTAARPWASLVHVSHGLRGHLVHEGFHAGVPAAGQTPSSSGYPSAIKEDEQRYSDFTSEEQQ